MDPLYKPPVMTNSFEVSADDTFPQIDFTRLGTPERPVDFPELKYYGFEHGDKTAKLATVILSHLGEAANKPANLRAVWVAGYFHDIGREAHWQTHDLDHALRSANILEHILRSDPELWADKLLQETACRLVAHHSTRPETQNPLDMALWDADCFESVRFAPGTKEGLVKLKERTALQNLCTDWAKDRSRLHTYMEFRGW